MCAEKINNPEEFTDADGAVLDEIIVKYWDSRDDKEKKRTELECYQQFKSMNFNDGVIQYLKENNCDELADEMEHFREVYQKVPHDHEKKKAA